MLRSMRVHAPSKLQRGSIQRRGTKVQPWSNFALELTALEHRGSAKKCREESALLGLGKRLLAAVQLSRWASQTNPRRPFKAEFTTDCKKREAT
jgi:hypothetical protein